MYLYESHIIKLHNIDEDNERNFFSRHMAHFIIYDLVVYNNKSLELF